MRNHCEVRSNLGVWIVLHTTPTDLIHRPVSAIERPPFEVTETGWGEFDIIIKIFFVPEAAEKPLTFTHHLKLHPWPLDLASIPPPASTLTGSGAANGSDADATQKPAAVGETPMQVDDSANNNNNADEDDAVAPAPEQRKLVLSPVHSWQYEEIVFVEPVEQFYAALLAHPPTPLPPKNRYPGVLKHQLGVGGNIGEFSAQMELDERDRMDKARQGVVDEMELLRKKLAGHEKELQGGFGRFCLSVPRTDNVAFARTALKKEVEDIQANAAASATPASVAPAATPAAA